MSVKSNPILDKLKKLAIFKKNKSKGSTKKPKEKKFKSPLLNLLHAIFSLTSNILLLVILVGCIGGVIVCNKILTIVDGVQEIDPTTIEQSLTENSMIIDQKGTVLETLVGEAGRRTIIEYEDISQNMIDAIVAIEDKTFSEHKGFNYIRLAGSAIQAAKSGNDARGTSTITQQLAKNLYLDDENSMERKIEEAYYAILLERNLTKDQIMWAYLNRISFGFNIYGVQSASNFYFSKDAKDLSLVESVILAGIPKYPGAYAPISRLYKKDVKPEHHIYDDNDPIYTLVYNPRAQNRFEFSLKQMYDNDMISEAEYMLRHENVFDYIIPTLDQSDGISSYFGDMVKDDAAKLLAASEGIEVNEAAQMIYNRGYIIESTIDFEIQEKLERIYNATYFNETFDLPTLEAIKDFQGDNGFTVNGIADHQTIAAIVEQTTYKATAFTKDVYALDMVDPEIISLKNALDQLKLLSNSNMFPRPTVLFNADGNILNDVTGKVTLFRRESLINADQQMVVNKNNFYYNENDDLVILKDKGLNFYLRDNGVQVVMGDMFTYEEGSEVAQYIKGQKFHKINGLYTYQGQDVMIPREYTSREEGNLIIDKAIFTSHPDFFKEDAQGNLLVESYNFYSVKRGVVQPQSAFVLMDQHTGEIKAIIGGRDSEGQNIFNRALQPQQPGSSIKPIGAYTVAIDSGQFTAASVIDDIPSFLNDKKPNVRWPYNWYEYYKFKYYGRQNLRQALDDSINVVAVKLAQEVGVDAIVDQLKALGITSLVESGPSNDMNLSALSLGGMTNGISPLEMTAAYATYANKGVYSKPITVSKITDLSGKVILDNVPEKRVVLSEQSAYILQDMMMSTVSNGVSSPANFSGMAVAGKTGTTSDNRDAIFVGFTPYYTAGIWFGNDIKLKMDNGSTAAAKLWRKIMIELHHDKEDIGFAKPEGLQIVSVDRVSGKRPSELSAKDPAGSQVYREMFLPGTAPTEIDDAHELVTICLDNDKHVLATEYCENTSEVVLRTRLEPYDLDEIPYLTKDYLLTVPFHTCELHTSETLEVNEEVRVEKVIQSFGGGNIMFIRDYSLLLENGESILVPKDSKILIDYTIVMPDGTEILPETYNILYVTKPELQLEEIYRRQLEAVDDTPEQP